MKEIKYSLGLDIGIASIGWAVMELDEDNNPIMLQDTGVVVVESMEDKNGNLINASRRNERGMRRSIRRRQHRVNNIRSLLSYSLDINNINDIYSTCLETVYDYKVKGLSEKLDKEELAIILIHYAKHRGFKSNRKNEVDSTDGVVLKAIEENMDLKGDLYTSEYILNHLDGVNKVKNTNGSYAFSFTRSEYEKEINAVLDKQIEFGLIDEDFKEKYIAIWGSQRDFSEGPGKGSLYEVNFAKVFGYCQYEPEELRAPKSSLSQQYNTLYTKLINLRYRRVGEYKYSEKLTPEQIKEVIIVSHKTGKISYKALNKIIDKDSTLEFKGIRSTKKDFIKCLNDYKNDNNIGMVDIADAKFKSYLSDKINDKEFNNLTSYHTLKKIFKKYSYEKVLIDLPIEYIDDIITALTFYKTDDRIRNYFIGNDLDGRQNVSNLDWSIYPDIVNDVIPYIPTSQFSESASLSLKVLYKINPLMKMGIDYKTAMEQCGYNHSVVNKEVKCGRHLPNIKKLLEVQYPNEISNPRVIRVLTRLGSLINSIVDTHGSPYYINIEMARDINLIRSKRRKIEEEQLNNLNRNENIKNRILMDYPNMSYHNISIKDVERYKLFDEQNGLCAYSLKMISEGDILTGKVEVDHILPISKSSNNTFNNKTLVYKKENQQKSDMTPLEYYNKYNLDSNKFKSFIANNRNFSNAKKANYLLENVDEIVKEMDGIEDTRFITKYLINILKYNLKFRDKSADDDSIRIIEHKAGYINYFKKATGISNLTHSMESLDYRAGYDYTIKEVTFDKDKSMKFKVSNIFLDDKNSFEVTIKMIKGNSYITNYEKKINSSLDYLFTSQVEFNSLVDETIMASNYSKDTILDKIKDINLDETSLEHVSFILTILKAEVQKLSIKKNRNNHLHHATDAIAVAALTRSMQMKISEFDKTKSRLLEALKKTDNIEITIGNKKYIVNNHLDFNQLEYKYLRYYFPKPYEYFDTEVKALVYERDLEKIKQMLPKHDKTKLRTLTPVKKVKQRYEFKNGKFIGKGLHKDTVYGIKYEGDTQVSFRTKNVLDLNVKDLENLYDKNGGARGTYIIIKEWLDNNKPTDYPMLSNGRLIKKVKVKEKDLNKLLPINRGYAEMKEVVRIDVYKRPNDDKMYFVGHSGLSLSNFFNNKEGKVQLWFGQGKNNLYVTFEELKTNFELQYSLHPGDLISIDTSKIKEVYAYVVGFTSGKLKIADIIGDNIELQNNLSSRATPIELTCSGIEKIQKKKITIRGVVK